MKKTQKYLPYLLGAVLLAGVVAVAALNSGQQFQGLLRLPGRTGVERVAGATCIAFVPAELKDTRGLKIGPARLNPLKFRGCESAKVKKIRYNMSGRNIEMTDLRVKLNDTDVTAKLTPDSKDRLQQARTRFTADATQTYSLDLEFSEPIEMKSTDYITLEATMSKIDSSSVMATAIENVAYLDTQTATYTNMSVSPTDSVVKMEYTAR